MESRYQQVWKRFSTSSRASIGRARSRCSALPAFTLTGVPAVAPRITPRASPTAMPRPRLNYQPTPKTITDRKLMNMKSQFGTNDLKVIIAYLYIDMAYRKEKPSEDKEISPVPPCRASGGNQERSRKKGSIIKLSYYYDFVELFPQLKILLAQQMTALQSTAPGTPFIYTEHVKSQNQKSKSPGVAYCRAEIRSVSDSDT